MAEALAARSMPGYQPQGAGRHAEFMGWRPSDMIGELLRVRGERNVPRNPTLLAERAFHTTSDFPLLLSAAANKMLLAAYQPAAPSYRQIFLRRDFRDFKPHRHLRVGDFPTLMPLMENGEIQAGTMSESQEIVLLQTFARRIRVTRPMLVNDDLGAFTDFAAAIGRRVADFENATAYALLNQANGDGPTLTNGQHITRIAAAVRFQHWRIARAELRHAHRIGRHVQLLGDAAEGWHEVTRPRAGGPDDLDRAGSAIHGGGCGDGAARGDRLPIGGKSIGQSGINRRGIGFRGDVGTLNSRMKHSPLSTTARMARACRP
jgi:hypothetical protein